jgi:RNA ligase (TIGR02306 family)
MSDVTRKLATIRKIDTISPIEGADLIEVTSVGGWNVVTKRGEFKAGDLAVYFEIDSFLKEGNPAWQFLVDKSSRLFDGERGHVLRTVKLRGVYSQGLLLPLDPTCTHIESELFDGLDVSEPLGIVKYERPDLPAQLAGLVKGNFPSCVPKTDQQRIQNLSDKFSNIQSTVWELTEKIEGSSATFVVTEQGFEVCSRNLSLKQDANNAFWGAAIKYDIESKIRSTGRNLAIQGEIFGEGIQGNIYKIKGVQFACFDIVDVGTRQYLQSAERLQLCKDLDIPHAPVLCEQMSLSDVTMQQLIASADGASVIGCKPKREGIVFKSLHGSTSFKCISNEYLAKQK